MGTAEIAGAAEILKLYGPWALVVILLVAIVYLFKYMNGRIDEKDHEWEKRFTTQGKELGDLLEVKNEQIITIVQNSSAVINLCNDELAECKHALINNTALNQTIHESIIRLEMIVRTCTNQTRHD